MVLWPAGCFGNGGEIVAKEEDRKSVVKILDAKALAASATSAANEASIHLPPIVWGVVRMESAARGAVVDVRLTHVEAVQAAKMAMVNAGADDRHAIYTERALSLRLAVPAVTAPGGVPETKQGNASPRS
jgi:hypothetical protein